MRKLFVLVFCALAFTVNAAAHTAFRLVSIEKRTVNQADLAKLQKEQSVGKIEKSNIRYDSAEVRLVVITGPSHTGFGGLETQIWSCLPVQH
jgi:hypothetical protein